MPLIQNQVSVGANATLANLLSGSIYEYLPFDCYVEVGLNASAPGLQAQVISGSDVLQEQGAMSQQNRLPIYPDDFALQDYAQAGDRLVVRVNNTTAGAITCSYGVKLTPV